MSCPICGKDPAAGYRPFCSRRCADVDLGRWLKGAYTIPAEAVDEGDDHPDTAAEPTPRPH